MPTGSAAASAPAGVTVLRAADRAVTRWRNGTGTTSEILVRRDPTAAPTGVGFDWRLSIATVSSDAAFSAFPGADRSLMALSAAGLNLTDNGVAVSLGQYDVHDFAGENAVAGIQVSGDTLDLNLMCDRDRRSGSLRLESVSGIRTIETGDAQEVAIVLLDGWLVTREQPGPWTTLAAHDAVYLRPGSGLELVGRGRIAVARVQPA